MYVPVTHGGQEECIRVSRFKATKSYETPSICSGPNLGQQEQPVVLITAPSQQHPFYLYVCVHLCVCVIPGTHKVYRRVLDPLEMMEL